MATHQEIDPLVLSRFVEKDNHRRHNCPDSDCIYKNYPSQGPAGSDNNLSCSSHGDNSHNDNSERKERNDQSRENLPEQGNKNKLGGNHSGLIIGGIITASLISLVTVLVVKKRKK